MAGAFDVLVVGGGIAGASVAAELSADYSVALLEAEDRPGYHATGRSAATYIVEYGPPPVRALTRASRTFFDAPPAGFCEGPLLRPRGAVLLAGHGQEAPLETELASARSMQRLTAAEAADLVPPLRPGVCIGAAYEQGAADIDVDLLHQGYLRLLKIRGGAVISNAEVQKGTYGGKSWTVSTPMEDFTAPILVNAAGAWGDTLAERLGVAPLGLVPKRRSVAVIDPAGGVDVSAWPLVAAVDMSFYTRPEGSGRLIVSPADETPSAPCDAWPEDIDLAQGIDAMQRMLDITVQRLDSSWAGLRAFAPDGVVVNGFDRHAPGFYWLVGQGGYGIQTAPAMAQWAASQIRGEQAPPHLAASGVEAEALSPARFRERGAD